MEVVATSVKTETAIVPVMEFLDQTERLVSVCIASFILSGVEL